jgi:hypothetical protein
MNTKLNKLIIFLLIGLLILSLINLASVVISKIPINVTDILPYGKDFDFLLENNPSKIYRHGDSVTIKFHIHKYKSYPETTFRTLVCKKDNLEFITILDTVHKNIPLGDTEAEINNLRIPDTAQVNAVCYIRYLINHRLENGRQDNDPAQTEEFTIVE